MFKLMLLTAVASLAVGLAYAQTSATSVSAPATLEMKAATPAPGIKMPDVTPTLVDSASAMDPMNAEDGVTPEGLPLDMPMSDMPLDMQGTDGINEAPPMGK